MTEETETKVKSELDSKSKHNVILIIIGILIVAGLGIGAYWWRDSQADKKEAELNQKVAKLETEVNNLKKKLSAKPANSTTPTTNKTNTASSETLGNIKDAISSGNYAALESYMAPSVTVIIAASEGIGSRTPAQATADMAYTDAGTDPWSFAIPAATLATYTAGPYAQYFPSGSLVGIAANNYLVVFSFDKNGKIKTIFLAANTDLLQ